MTGASELFQLSLTALADWLRQMITLSAAILAASVAFLDTKATAPSLLFLLLWGAWALLLATAGLGIFALRGVHDLLSKAAHMAMQSDSLRASGKVDMQDEYLNAAKACQWTFLAGLTLLVLFAGSNSLSLLWGLKSNQQSTHSTKLDDQHKSTNDQPSLSQSSESSLEILDARSW